MCLYSNYYYYYTLYHSSILHTLQDHQMYTVIPLAVVSSHSKTSQITTGILIQSTILICVFTNSLFLQYHHTHQS